MSATETITFSVQTNAREYSDAIAQYAADTGKAISAALLREGPDFAKELFNQFKAISPNAASIADAAKARHFKMGRKDNEFAHSIDGLSVKARNAAYAAMGGDISDLFKHVGSDFLMVPARFSARKGHRLLIGGHAGRKIAKSALRASQLSSDELAASVGDSGVVRLNQRAVATYYEIIFRQRGAHGFMASQWLYKTWKRHAQYDASTGYTKLLADPKAPELVARAGSGKPTGKIEFETGSFGGIQNIVLTGMVPGTAAQMQKHSILPKIATARIASLANAIKKHHQKVASHYKLN